MRLLSVWMVAVALALAATVPVNYIVESIAGSDRAIDGGLATLSIVEDAQAVAVDSFGNIFFSDTSRHCVYRISPGGMLITVAGTGKPGFSGDGGSADGAALNQPYGIAVDSAGNLFIADLQNSRVRRVSAEGRIATVAGGGTLPISSGAGLAIEVALKGPRNVAVDAAGNLFISDFLDHRILRVSSDGRIGIVAGSGNPGPTTDSVPALQGQLSYPAGLFLGSAGSLYVADSGNHAIRFIRGSVMTTLRFQNSSAFVNLPTAISLDAAGNYYVASAGFDQAVRISPAGVPVFIAQGARDLAADAVGNLYLAAGPFVRKLSTGGQLSTLAGISGQFRGEGTPPALALLYAPGDVKSDSSGSILIADTLNHRVRRISGGLITTVAGDGESGFRGDNGAAVSARLSGPQSIAIDRAGNLYIADSDNHRVRRVNAGGQITTIAGTGTAGNNGDIRNALEAQLSYPTGVAVDGQGQIVVSDTGNHRVCRITPSGFVVTIAGNGKGGFGGDGLGSLLSRLDTPRGVAFDTAGNLYIADSGNQRIRRITAAGVISTFAGNGQTGFAGDGLQAAEANLNNPTAVAVDAAGTVFLSDSGNRRVRAVTPDGVIQTIAGEGTRGSSGDRGPALQAKFDDPAGLAVDSDGNVYVADRFNHRIRRLTPVVVVPAPPPGVILTPPVRTIHTASLENTVLVPGMLVSIQGTGIGPPVPQSGHVGPSGSLDTSLANTEVRFDGRVAPILYAQDNLINVQVPYRISGQPLSQVEVFRDGLLRGSMVVNVAPYAPGIFASVGGFGQATALNEDSSLNSLVTRASRGSLITLYATGEGLTDPASTEGRFADPPYPVPLALVTVSIGGQAAEIISLGSGVTSPGVLQVVVRVPSQASAGAAAVVLTVGGVASQRGVTIAVR